MDVETEAMKLITNAGQSRSLSFEALKVARNGKFEKAKDKLEEANNKALEAHKIQRQLITKEAEGEDIELGLLMVHAQDHLMNSMLAKDLILELLELYKELKNYN
ncbi:PTS lactose/cellobiose transporter subunit IIA [Halanaerocella petrolearia]